MCATNVVRQNFIRGQGNGTVRAREEDKKTTGSFNPWRKKALDLIGIRKCESS